MKKTPYIRQISAFNENNQLTDIVKYFIDELKVHNTVQYD